LTALEITTGTATNSSQVIFSAQQSGRIGIGTTSPGRKLDVNGDANIGTNLVVGTAIYDPGNFYSAGSGHTFNSVSAAPLLTIAESGKVGINTISVLSHQLEVDGNTSVFFTTGTSGTSYSEWVIANAIPTALGYLCLEGSVTGNCVTGDSAGDFVLEAGTNHRFIIGSGNGAGVGVLVDTSAGVHLGTTSGTQIYRCSGGTAALLLTYGNSGAEATVCTTGGGTMVGTGTFLP
jgi:hypothetical protein